MERWFNEFRVWYVYSCKVTDVKQTFVQDEIGQLGNTMGRPYFHGDSISWPAM